MVRDIFKTTVAGILVPRKNSNYNGPHSLSACYMRGTVLNAYMQ